MFCCYICNYFIYVQNKDFKLKLKNNNPNSWKHPDVFPQRPTLGNVRYYCLRHKNFVCLLEWGFKLAFIGAHPSNCILGNYPSFSQTNESFNAHIRAFI